MTYLSAQNMGLSPLFQPVDILLADVAVRVQLTNTDYSKAVQRYTTIADWIDRPDSPLTGRVNLLYPQGSMAIGATIASRLRTDEFDIDIVADLALPFGTPPEEVLDLLFASIRGERGSRYYTMAERRTRCVTVHYADAMHLDVTPAILLPLRHPRTSHIFHSKPEDPDEPDRALVANPYGFAEWYKANTPLDHDFAARFEKRAADWEIVAKAAETEDVPPRQPPYRKSKATITLQLIKRWRNVRYDRREGRRPPSIVLAKLIADAANHTGSLSEELYLQAVHILKTFREAHQRNQLIRVENPTCRDDVLTDRWPASSAEQALLISDLEDLVAKVAILRGDCSLDRMQAIMKDLFGEAPTAEVFKSFNAREIGRPVAGGASLHRPAQGGFVLGGAAAPASVASRRTPFHTFFGADEEG